MPDHDTVDPVLDGALSRLHADRPIDERVLAEARARVVAAVAETSRPRRHPSRWIAAAAVVVVGVAGLQIAQTVSITGAPVVASAAAGVLDTAAGRITTVDTPLRPGQYRYIRHHGWHLTEQNGTSGKNYSVLVETTGETWIPADPTQEWLSRNTTTGKREWVTGSEAEARADGVDLDRPMTLPDGETLALCGDFTATLEGRTPCAGGFGGWYRGTTPEFLAGLPRDPRQLYEMLRAEAASSGADPDVAILEKASNLIGAEAPADLRRAVYRALTHLPALKVTDEATTLDGHRGVALGVDKGSERLELVIDPATGNYVGSRRWAGGELFNSSSATTAVVDEMGALPER